MGADETQTLDEHLIELLGDYDAVDVFLHGTLVGNGKEKAEAHLKECASCSEGMRWFREQMSMVD